MSLDVYLTKTQPVDVYQGNVTNNLVPMACEAGVYEHIWMPEEIGITKAQQLIGPLENALVKMCDNPARFERYNPTNGLGSYQSFLGFVQGYLDACRENPDADVRVNR